MMIAPDRTDQGEEAGAPAPADADGSRPPGRGRRDRRPAARGPRFEPARLWLGLWLLAIAAAFVARAGGHLDVPLRFLAVSLPLALVTTAAVAIGTYLVRRRRLFR